MLNYSDKIERDEWLKMLDDGEAVLCPSRSDGRNPLRGVLLVVVPEWVVVGHRCQSVNRWGKCNGAVYPSADRGNVPRLCRICTMLYRDRGWGKTPRVEAD